MPSGAVTKNCRFIMDELQKLCATAETPEEKVKYLRLLLQAEKQRPKKARYKNAGKSTKPPVAAEPSSRLQELVASMGGREQ